MSPASPEISGNTASLLACHLRTSLPFTITMSRITLLQLTAVCLISASIPAATAFSAASHAVRMLDLVERASSTCGTNYTPCGQNTPSDWCCPSSNAPANASTCEVFNGGKGAICCPVGKDCSHIGPIECNSQLLNATLNAKSGLWSTELPISLQQCGSACCPPGYSCTNNNECVQSSRPSATSSKTSQTSSPNDTSTTSSSNVPTNSAVVASQTSTPAPSAAQQNQFPTNAVLVGFFPGMVAGCILAVFALCCFGRRRSKEERDSPSPDFSSVTATVSDPIYQGDSSNAFRTDFLRRESKSKYENRMSRVRSLFSRTPTLRSMRSREAAVDGIGRSIPKVPSIPHTPVNQRSVTPSLKKEPSTESIKIYSPPNQDLGRPTTTFDSIMREVGMEMNKPFVPLYAGSPGRVGLGLDSALHGSDNRHR